MLHHAHRLAGTLRAALPGQCPLCRAWPVWGQPAGICLDCQQRFTTPRTRCEHCALPLPQVDAPCPACARRPSPLHRCVAAVDYAYPWNTLLAQFKYQQRAALAQPLAHWMATQAGSAELLQAADWIVPVPLTAARLRERGYNQAWELARALAVHSNLRHKARADLVERTVDGPAQARLGRLQRLHRPSHGFEVVQRDAVAGRHLLLVDDVMTTGATLFALAHCLQAAGAANVSALVFARTDAPHDARHSSSG